MPAQEGSGEGSLLGHWLLTVPSHGRKQAKELSGVPFIRAPIPFTNESTMNSPIHS